MRDEAAHEWASAPEIGGWATGLVTNWDYGDGGSGGSDGGGSDDGGGPPPQPAPATHEVLRGTRGEPIQGVSFSYLNYGALDSSAQCCFDLHLQTQGGRLAARVFLKCKAAELVCSAVDCTIRCLWLQPVDYLWPAPSSCPPPLPWACPPPPCGALPCGAEACGSA
jgi:hypothetical protein